MTVQERNTKKKKKKKKKDCLWLCCQVTRLIYLQRKQSPQKAEKGQPEERMFETDGREWLSDRVANIIFFIQLTDFGKTLTRLFEKSFDTFVQ